MNTYNDQKFENYKKFMFESKRLWTALYFQYLLYFYFIYKAPPSKPLQSRDFFKLLHNRCWTFTQQYFGKEFCAWQKIPQVYFHSMNIRIILLPGVCMLSINTNYHHISFKLSLNHAIERLLSLEKNGLIKCVTIKIVGVEIYDVEKSSV